MWNLCCIVRLIDYMLFYSHTKHHAFASVHYNWFTLQLVHFIQDIDFNYDRVLLYSLRLEEDANEKKLQT